jgi:hypothetical protein
VYVTGWSDGGRATGLDYATVAYRAGTGRQLWVSRYNGPGNREDLVRSMAVNPNGHVVYVTGYSWGGVTGTDYATVAYSAATGRQLWVSSYNGPGNQEDTAESVAVNPRGTRVYVTGYSNGGTTGDDYATVAYSAATGRQLWVSRYTSPGNGGDVARSVAMNPAGTAVFVTGSSNDQSPDADYVTIAYRS